MFRLLPWLLLPQVVVSQTPLTPVQLSELAPGLSEASALLFVNGATWTLVDGTGQPELYAIDPHTGQVVRTLGLVGATRTDWEALARDDMYIYVGDIGNNQGSRQDLRIFRFPLDSLTTPGVQSVAVDTISFAYADQTDFTPAPFVTAYDCEAMLVVDGEVLLFTKRWNDEHSRLYRLPAQPGTWTAQPDTLFDTMGLVTDATRDPVSGDVFLSGHRFALPFLPFVWALRGISGSDVFQGSATRHPITQNDIQLEGCACAGGDSLLLVNETFQLVPAACWTLHMPGANGMPGKGEAPVPRAWPNPFHDRLRLGSGPGSTVRAWDGSGRMIHAGSVPVDGLVDTSAWPPGICLVEVVSAGVRHRFRAVRFP